MSTKRPLSQRMLNLLAGIDKAANLRPARWDDLHVEYLTATMAALMDRGLVVATRTARGPEYHLTIEAREALQYTGIWARWLAIELNTPDSEIREIAKSLKLKSRNIAGTSWSAEDAKAIRAKYHAQINS